MHNIIKPLVATYAKYKRIAPWRRSCVSWTKPYTVPYIKQQDKSIEVSPIKAAFSSRGQDMCNQQHARDERTAKRRTLKASLGPTSPSTHVTQLMSWAHVTNEFMDACDPTHVMNSVHRRMWPNSCHEPAAIPNHVTNPLNCLGGRLGTDHIMHGGPRRPNTKVIVLGLFWLCITSLLAMHSRRPNTKVIVSIQKKIRAVPDDVLGGQAGSDFPVWG